MLLSSPCDNQKKTKNQKTYILFDLEPAREITRRMWNPDNRFETNLVDNLKAVILFLAKNGVSDARFYSSFLLPPSCSFLLHGIQYVNFSVKASISASSVSEEIRRRGIVKGVFPDEDISALMCSLVYEGLLEIAPNQNIEAEEGPLELPDRPSTKGEWVSIS